MKLIEDVDEIIQENKLYIPEGYAWWQTTEKPATIEEFIEDLIKIFGMEERQIKFQQRLSVNTERYEDNVRNFAIDLLKRLSKEYVVLRKIKSYKILLGKRHMAYAFYYLLDINAIESHNILENIVYKKYLYQGLVRFYTVFYGNFSDNEEAICLLCKYYPKDNDSWLDKQDVVNALFDHIRNAGTPDDLGYAYRGIEEIEQHIHGLSDEVIRMLLKEYRLYDVINQKIYRHQMFAIINGSGFEKKAKDRLKFFYLDSLMLANFFNNIWLEMERERDGSIEVYYNDYDIKLAEQQIQVLDKPQAYWENANTRKRLFWVEGEEMARIIFDTTKIILAVRQNEDRFFQYEFFFEYHDWALEDLQTRAVREKIHAMISGEEVREEDEKPMAFSLLYLNNNYRGITGRLLDFDPRFMFETESKELKRQEEGQRAGFHFYGKAVYSLSCIVGKNGTGKTSIVDFLRDSFYKMLKILEDFDTVSCTDGYVESEEFYRQKILDKGMDFLVVFHIRSEDYFLTNMKGIKYTGILPYQKGICDNLGFCKVVYFSQQMRTDQLFSIGDGERTNREEVSSVSRALEGIGQCDYSQMKSYRQRKNALSVLEQQNQLNQAENESAVNRELCYQYTLLRHRGAEKVCQYLDISPTRKFAIYNLKSGEILAEFMLEDCKADSPRKGFEQEYLRMPETEIGFWSSGQHAMFTFLARLYWFLEGWRKDKDYYREIFHRQVFAREDILQPGDSALIFIDEGELYYHPEWQRRYLAILLDMLRLCKGKARLQVVFTTNSPFVLSDVLKEDVQYLSGKQEEFGETLGQNIHTLLKNNFFMDYTIGEYSRRLIEAIISQIGSEDGESEERKTDMSDYFDDTEDMLGMLGYLIQQIGEPIYRDKLEKMLEERRKKSRTHRENRIQELEKQREELQRQIMQLKGE